MNIKSIYQTVLAIVLTIVISQPATADLVVNFSIDDGASFSNSFNVVTGDSLQIGVYLMDTQAGGVLENDGLFGFGLTGATSPTNLGSITAATINPVFDFDVTDTFTASTIAWEDAVLNNMIPTGQSILLGTFQFDTILAGSTLFTFGDIQPGPGPTNANWLSGTGSVLDETIFGTGASNTFQMTVNASAVPEPGSSFLVGLAVIGLVARRRRT